jgi:nucleoside-triphosphatase
MKIFISGAPGSGKSTLLSKVIEILRSKGLKIGGIVTPEIRINGRRVGFKVVDIYNGKEGILASIDKKTGIRFGKYFINLDEFEKISLNALDFASENCDLIVIDEIGKMEFFSKAFREKIDELLRKQKPMICVLHREFMEKYKKYGKIFIVNLKNREKLPQEIVDLFKEQKMF